MIESWKRYTGSRSWHGIAAAHRPWNWFLFRVPLPRLIFLPLYLKTTPCQPLQLFPGTFSLPPLPSSLIVTSAMTTEKIHSESPEEFEFIETPPASCITPADPCGVRTTTVSFGFFFFGC